MNARPAMLTAFILSILLSAPLCQADVTPVEPESIPKFLNKALVALFDKGEIAVPDGANFKEMRFRLFRPVVQTGKRYPLILYLNGHAARQLDYNNVGQLSHLDTLIFSDPNSRKKYPFFLLAPQCPKAPDGKWLNWVNESRNSREKYDSADPIEAVGRVIDKVLAENPVDPNRVTVFGISSGGTASWELAMRRPTMLAALVPLASFPDAAGDGRLEKLASIPIWAFHSGGDKPEIVNKTISWLESSGGDCHLTIVPKNLHPCWDEAFGEYDLVNWMLAQQRGENPPGQRSSLAAYIWWQNLKRDYLRQEAWRKSLNEFWPRAIPISAVIAIAIAYKRSRNRKLENGRSEWLA